MPNNTLAAQARDVFRQVEAAIAASSHPQKADLLQQWKVLHARAHRIGQAFVSSGDVTVDSIGGDKNDGE
jgi:hypothetical protein